MNGINTYQIFTKQLLSNNSTKLSLRRYVFFKFPVLTYNRFPTQREKEKLFLRLLRYLTLTFFVNFAGYLYDKCSSSFQFMGYFKSSQHILVRPIGSDLRLSSRNN